MSGNCSAHCVGIIDSIYKFTWNGRTSRANHHLKSNSSWLSLSLNLAELKFERRTIEIPHPGPRGTANGCCTCFATWGSSKSLAFHVEWWKKGDVKAPRRVGIKSGTKKGTFHGNAWTYIYQSSSNGLLEAYFLVILQVFSEWDFCLDQRIVKSNYLTHWRNWTPGKLSGFYRIANSSFYSRNGWFVGPWLDSRKGFTKPLKGEWGGSITIFLPDNARRNMWNFPLSPTKINWQFLLKNCLVKSLGYSLNKRYVNRWCGWDLRFMMGFPDP